MGEIEILAHFSDFFVFKNGDFTHTGTFYSLIRSRMIFLRALLFQNPFKINTSLIMQLLSKASGFRAFCSMKLRENKAKDAQNQCFQQIILYVSYISLRAF